MTNDLRHSVGVLTERRNWLTARIAAKQSVGWDVEYDTRERDALSDVVGFLGDERIEDAEDAEAYLGRCTQHPFGVEDEA